MSGDANWRELYPFQSYVRMLDGHRFHYLDEGKGPVLLMVHGNPTWSFYWRDLVKAFRGRCRVVVPDHIGCGLSDKPQDYPYTLAQHVRNLTWLVEQLDLRDVTLLVHDWGGAIGFGAAEAAPARFSRFVLFNTAAFRPTSCPLRIRACRVPLFGKLAVQGFNAFARAALKMATNKPERMTPAVRAGYLAPYNSWANRIATHRFVMDIPLSRTHVSYHTLTAIEHGLTEFHKKPVQIIWGMRDWCFTARILERFVDDFFPQAEVTALDDAGHYVVEDAHEQIVPLVEQFLIDHGVLPKPHAPVDPRPIAKSSPIATRETDVQVHSAASSTPAHPAATEATPAPQRPEMVTELRETEVAIKTPPVVRDDAPLPPSTSRSVDELSHANSLLRNSGKMPAPPASLAPSNDIETVNVARRLREMARDMPEVLAAVHSDSRDPQGKRVYDRITFSQLDRVSDRLARGLRELGVLPGTRLVLMVPPSIPFITLVFALLKAGAVMVLIDPGMGRRNIFKCLDEIQPEGFISIPKVQTLRALFFWRYRRARFNVVVGGTSRLGKAVTFDELRGRQWSGFEMAPTKAEDPAAILFTTGSTGPPKGVLYRHGNFDAQVEQLRDFYEIRPGEVSLSGFPLFSLFDAAMGMTTVIPDMDPTRPAQVDPRNIIEAVDDWKVTQAFGSPAMWNRVGRYAEEQKVKLKTLRRVLSAGAPVPPRVLRKMKACIHPEGDVHTPYGATEALPVSSIAASEVFLKTVEKSSRGAGTCVGRKFPGIEWKVIRVCDGSLASLDEIDELPAGEIGELIVRGPVVTTEYYNRPKANALAKIVEMSIHRESPADEKQIATTIGSQNRGATATGLLQKSPSQVIWHRMGDVGYLDDDGRFWFCGRLAHRVLTARGPMYTIPCEAIFNEHPLIYRSALVGVGPRDRQQPVIILEPESGKMPKTREANARLFAEALELARANPLTRTIEHFLLHPSLPVDIRHNSKIFREQLAVWAARKVRTR